MTEASRCVECGVDLAINPHMEWCTSYLSPAQIRWAAEKFIRKPDVPPCPECGLRGMHAQTCTLFLTDKQIRERKRLVQTVDSWERQKVLGRYAARFLRYLVAQGQDLELYRGPTGTPHVEWGGVQYEPAEINQMALDNVNASSLSEN